MTSRNDHFFWMEGIRYDPHEGLDHISIRPDDYQIAKYLGLPTDVRDLDHGVVATDRLGSIWCTSIGHYDHYDQDWIEGNGWSMEFQGPVGPPLQGPAPCDYSVYYTEVDDDSQEDSVPDSDPEYPVF